MNPGVQALERLVEMGVFSKGSNIAGDTRTQYWACGRPTPRKWVQAAGLVHKASSWVGVRGLTVMCGRQADEVIFCYDSRGDT